MRQSHPEGMPHTKENAPSLFIQFAGQGTRYMDDLQRLYTTVPVVQPFIQEAIAEIKRQAAGYDDRTTNFFSQGLDVDTWIIHPETAPDLGYLLSSPLSHPLIFLTQFSHYFSFLLEGVDQNLLLAHTHSVTGFSTGIVAALLVSSALPLNDLWKMAIRVQAMFFWQGIRTQQAMRNFGVQPSLDASRYHTAEGAPSSMAGIIHLLRKRLDDAILQFDDQGRIYPAYDLFPGRWIVSALPDDLWRFRDFLKAREPSAVFRYIPSTIGAHSPLLAPALTVSPNDAEVLGIRFSDRELRVPVWANDTGEDLRQYTDIMNEVIRAYYIAPGAWRKQISPLLPPSRIKYVLDFGPGTGIASLTENHIAQSGIRVIRCTLPLGRRQVFKDILPDLETG